MLGGDQVISSIKDYYQGADTNLPLAERLLECLKQEPKQEVISEDCYRQRCWSYILIKRLNSSYRSP